MVGRGLSTSEGCVDYLKSHGRPAANVQKILERCKCLSSHQNEKDLIHFIPSGVDSRD